MNNILSQMSENIRHKQNLITRIKVTSEFADYLRTLCHYETTNMNTCDGVRGAFIGVPMDIDDTIKNKHYEFVY